jgi:methylated-DNA-[protein]-cysteine S-methyltransferase
MLGIRRPCAEIAQCREASATGPSGRKQAPPHVELFPPERENATSSAAINTTGSQRAIRLFREDMAGIKTRSRDFASARIAPWSNPDDNAAGFCYVPAWPITTATMSRRMLARDPSGDGRFSLDGVSAGVRCLSTDKTATPGRETAAFFRPEPRRVHGVPSGDTPLDGGVFVSPQPRYRSPLATQSTHSFMRQFYDTFPTPAGDFSVALDASGAVLATAFGGLIDLRERFSADELIHDPVRTADVRRELQEYFASARRRFTVKIAPAGTPFQLSVWAALQRIPFGQTRTYGGLAEEIGKPDAARAVGRANGSNPICVIVPCHRVIGSHGGLTGFAFGDDLKRWLLAHEGVSSPALV